MDSNDLWTIAWSIWSVLPLVPSAHRMLPPPGLGTVPNGGLPTTASMDFSAGPVVAPSRLVAANPCALRIAARSVSNSFAVVREGSESISSIPVPAVGS
jgi:hypothetical protein